MTTAADLIRSGQCSAACLLSTSKRRRCRCACQGDLHGTLAAVVVHTSTTTLAQRIRSAIDAVPGAADIPNELLPVILNATADEGDQ